MSASMSTSSSSSASDSAASAPTIAPFTAFSSTSDSVFPSSILSSPTSIPDLPSQAPPTTATPATLGFHWTTYALPKSIQVDAGTLISASVLSSSSSSLFATPNRLWSNTPTRTSESTPSTPSQSSPPAGPLDLAQSAVSSTGVRENDADNISVSVLGGHSSAETVDHLADVDASRAPVLETSSTIQNWAALVSKEPENHNTIPPYTMIPVTRSVGSARRLPDPETPTFFPYPTSSGSSSNGDNASHKSNSSAIIGAICGGIAFLTITLVLFFLFFRRNKRRGLSLPEDRSDRGWSYMVEIEKHRAPIHSDVRQSDLESCPTSLPPEIPPRPRTSNPNPFVSPYDPSPSRRNTRSSISSSIHFASRSSTPEMPEPESLVSSSFKYNLSYHPRNAIQQPSLMTVVDLIRGQKGVGNASMAGWDEAEARTND